jgi:hypothetical protein
MGDRRLFALEYTETDIVLVSARRQFRLYRFPRVRSFAGRAQRLIEGEDFFMRIDDAMLDTYPVTPNEWTKAFANSESVDGQNPGRVDSVLRIEMSARQTTRSATKLRRNGVDLLGF